MWKDSVIPCEEFVWFKLKVDEKAWRKEKLANSETQTSFGVKSTRNIILRRKPIKRLIFNHRYQA